MKHRFISLIILFSLFTTFCIAQVSYPNDSIYAINNPMFLKKHPWDAAAITAGLNVGVWAFNRYLMNEEFARINIHTIRDNFKRGFVWDNDQFSTNLFAHPYHGSLYFNAARSNGFSFWGSAPYALGGSLMWEFFAEREPAAINDLLATTIGGMALGEITYRMSSLFLNDSKRGFQRVAGEFLSTVISPMRGLNRILNGRMFKVDNKYYKYHNYEEIPVKLSLGTGLRYLADDNYMFKGDYNPYLDISLLYGNAFDSYNDAPYDYFKARLSFSLSPNQPLINRVSIIGKLWNSSVKSFHNIDYIYGLYQYFNYFDSEKVIDNSDNIPYKISEAASVGPGVIFKFPSNQTITKLEHSIFLGGIILGGGITDYYNVIDRNYNMGSGYSVKNGTLISIGKYCNINYDFQLYQIFTWKGYIYKDLENTNPLYLNSQGDKGSTLFIVMNPKAEIFLNKHIKGIIEGTYYLRQTHYSYRKDVFYRTFETKCGFTYQF